MLDGIAVFDFGVLGLVPGTETVLSSIEIKKSIDSSSWDWALQHEKIDVEYGCVDDLTFVALEPKQRFGLILYFRALLQMNHVVYADASETKIM